MTQTSIPVGVRLGVALGGGAARGFAHIGFLDALTDRGLRPAMISGSSIGALVGAVFVAGSWRRFVADVLNMRKSEMLSLFRPGLPWRSLFSQEPILDFLAPYLRHDDLARADPPLAVMAADVLTGEEVVLRTGSILDAVRASTALPGLFPPVAHDGRLLFDGGLVQPVPVAACDRTVCDFVVGVDLNAQVLSGGCATSVLRMSMPRAMLHAGYVMMRTISRESFRMCPPDILVEPELAEVGILEVHKGRTAYEAGYAACPLAD